MKNMHTIFKIQSEGRLYITITSPELNNGEIEGDRERQRETERDRERQRDTDRETERQTEREIFPKKEKGRAS